MLKADKIVNQNSLYVLINIFVSAVGFARSFIFMKWLNMSDLGIISLMQTVILFVSLFQMGLINGGYRIFALDRADEQRNINNVLFSYFALITGIVLLFWLSLVVMDIRIIISNDLMLIALVCGILTLGTNWLTNTLIGKRLIKSINLINLISGCAMLVVLPLVTVWGMIGATVALVAQPVLFITITLIRHKDLRPTGWNFNIKLIRYILSFGFIPFLAGIFININIQVERWSIAQILGTEALGEFYLVFIYSTLFVLIPTSILSLFFPKTIYAYENNNIVHFKSLLKKHFLTLISYLIIVVLFTIFALQFFIDTFLPAHSANTQYVYYYIPGLIALVLCDPMSIIFNSAIRLKPILYAGLAGVVANAGLIFLTEKASIFTLTNMAIIKTIVNFIPLVIYLLYLTVNYKAVFKIRR